MKTLNDAEIEKELKKVPAWQRKGKGIERKLTFKDFLESISFVNRLAATAERLNHHPDILILYNKVELNVWTHDAGGLTLKDFELAAAVEGLAH